MYWKRSRGAAWPRCLAFLIFISVVLGARSGSSIVPVGDFAEGCDAQGIPKGWRLTEKSGKANFSLVQTNDNNALVLRSANTSFSFQKQINVDLNESPVLNWKWMVNKVPAGGDFRKSSTDDQAAQLFIAFGRTKSIVYLWDTSAPQGLMTDAPSPPFMTVKAVVVRSGSHDLGKWLLEKRNVLEDYRKLYGTAEKPPPISGMRLQINTQHTKTSGECCFADLNFAAK